MSLNMKVHRGMGFRPGALLAALCASRGLIPQLTETVMSFPRELRRKPSLTLLLELIVVAVRLNLFEVRPELVHAEVRRSHQGVRNKL